MKRFYFIVNPISGHANNTKYAEDIIALLHKKADVETHMHVLQARGEAEPYAAKLADEIKDDGIIVSVGGDGTFNEIASSLVGKSTPIAIIPRGSGNGLARMLRVPTQKALQAEYLLKGHTIKIDNGNFGDRKYFCTAGFGFEACIAFLFDKTGNKKRGRQQYVHHIIKEIFNYKPVEAELEIDGKSLKVQNTTEVSEQLRGEPGTTFVLKVQRPGEKKTREFKITRRNIKKSALPYYGMYGNAGYIHLTEFIENCSKDVRKAFINLKEQGAKTLILDLRDNHGGLLTEAVDIVNLFVPKGLTIVETRGKLLAASSKYVTNNEPLDLDVPIVVLVNKETASAAEIVAGALQDLDRAVIVGNSTFGKGLVQSPRDLPYNGSIKLTTAKYYIPSGRCVQAIDYKKEREAAELYRTTGKRINTKDSIAHKTFHTAGGREVTEGSGVKPDIDVAHDTLSNIVFYLSDDDVLVDWGTRYFQKHPSIPAVRDFALTDADYEDFKDMVKASGFKYDRLSVKRLEDLTKTMRFEGYYEEAKDLLESLEAKLAHNLDKEMDRKKTDILKIMSLEVVKRYYYQAGMAEEALKGDKDLEKAIEIVSDQSAYNKILGKS